jgi:hypothetical protein
MKHGIYLVGSVPMKDAAEVFQTLSAALGPALRYLPDGETGERISWLPWLTTIFAEHPDFHLVQKEYQIQGVGNVFQRYALNPGVDPKSVRFTKGLRQHQVAMESWKVFRDLKAQGKIPAHVRYQVTIASILSLLNAFLVESLNQEFVPALEEAMLGQVARICADIPHDQLAIQFDVPTVFYHLQTGKPRFGATREEMMKNFVAMHLNLGNAIPKDVHLIYHFCYGDNNHKHAVEPTDMTHMVNFANALSGGMARTIELIHMPVPKERNDDAYFEPLKNLKLRPETTLALGLVHYTGGIEGTRQRIATAQKYFKDFVIGTECGFGRRDPATVPKLLEIHAQAAGIQ